MFDGWTQWTWVTIAWLELVLAYGAYLTYLGWRRRKLLADDAAHRVIERQAAGGWIVKRKWVYGLAGVGVLAVAGFMIFQALSTSLVYFILPNEHAADPAQYDGRRIRLGGIVTPGTIAFDERELQLTFLVTDGLVAYPVRHSGAPPELFKESTGVVVEGRFNEGTFVSDNVLVKHTEVYVAEGEHIDLELLRESLK